MTQGKNLVAGRIEHIDTLGKNIVFLGYDVAEWTCSGWSSYAECCSNTDNDIYLFVDEWLKDHNKK